MNLTLSLIHPKLFETGLDILRKLREWDDTKAVAREWQSVYTGISIISNRVTSSHRASRGRAEWYDLLANYCDEDDTAASIPHLLIRDLGLDLSYSSGTVIGLCGSVLEHEVGSLLLLQTIKAIVDSHSFKSPKSDEPRRVQVLDLYCLTRFESESSSKGIVC